MEPLHQRDGRFSSGIWECQPGKWRVVFSESEFCHWLAGVVEVTGDDGSVRTYRAGDAFVMPAGFTGIWDVQEPSKKYYASTSSPQGARDAVEKGVDDDGKHAIAIDECELGSQTARHRK